MPHPRNERHPGVDEVFVSQRGNFMNTYSFSKKKEDLVTEKELSEAEGDTDRTGFNKEGRCYDDEPFKRRSSLARTPPTSTPLGTPDHGGAQGGKIPLERPIGEEHRDRDNEKRKRREEGRLDNRRLRIQVEGLMEGARSAPTSPSTGVLDLTLDETSLRSAKKKKEEYGSIFYKQVGCDAIATSLGGIIKKIGDEVRVVTDAAKERNTKKEVKEAAVKLKNLVSRLTTVEAQELFQKLERGPDEASLLTDRRQADWEKGIAKVEEEVTLLKRTNEQIRAENNALRERNETLLEKNRRLKGKIQELENPSGTAIAKMEDAMFAERTYEHFAGVEGLIWPKTIYRAVRFTAESSHTGNKDMDLLVLQGKRDASRNSEKVLDKYPELNEIDGKIGAISILTKTIEGDGATKERERWVERVRAEDGDEDLFEALTRVRDLLQKGGRTKIGLDAPEWDTSRGITSKILEYIFRDSGIVCDLYISDNTGADREKRKRGPALILRQEGKGYADALRNLKDKVRPGSSISKAIRTIRETREGNMVVVLDKDNQHLADDLRKEIRRAGDIEIVRDFNDDDAAVFISGVDGVTSKEEIKKAIGEASGLEANNIKIGDLRSAYGGNQTAVVNIPKAEADALLRLGGIRIGLNWCPIREKVGVTRCFRCWQYGHIGRNCVANIDESKLCRKCGEGGHIARNCDRSEKCLTYKQEGHVAGSGRCPEFRKAVARERLKRKQKRSY